mgnify:CR=1 FL=1|tara:strand:+ start:410 stop:1555 length:1146 start_codon:yes stop_codon:yes gene_type:complete
MFNCTRRSFLIGGATSVFFSGLNLSTPVVAKKNKKNLVVVMLRGGLDGLSAVPAIGDKKFKKYRKNLYGEYSKDVFKINTDFGLHPKLEHFNILYGKNEAAVVHATNTPYVDRSHFDGQDVMMSGGLRPYAVKTGWLGRGMITANIMEPGLTLSLPMPLLLRGAEQKDNYFPANGTIPEDKVLNKLISAYQNDDDMKTVMENIRKRPVSRFHGENDIDNLAKHTGKILNEELGPNVAVFDIDGFDTHAGQLYENNKNLEQFDKLLKTLESSSGDAWKNTLIVTLTEFGRTVRQNGGQGTDHGIGTAILMAGGLIKKGQVYTDWPGLKKKQLYEGRDLAATIDARAVYNSAMSAVFDYDVKKMANSVYETQLTDLTNILFSV